MEISDESSEKGSRSVSLSRTELPYPKNYYGKEVELFLSN